MAFVSGEAFLGSNHLPPLHEEITLLAKIMATVPEQVEKVQEARNNLLNAKKGGNQHALLDTAGVIGFFASITIIVDATGHYSDEFPNDLARLGTFLSAGHRMRSTLGSLWTLKKD